EKLWTSELSSPDGIDVDMETMQARQPWPICPGCGALARPNILMFGDGQWDEARAFEQEQRLHAWLRRIDGKRLVLIECGAGTAVRAVGQFGGARARGLGGTLTRTTAREPHVPAGHVGLAMGALEALRRIEERYSG